MVVRQNAERTQIGVLEDGVLVEHYVARKDQASMIGNVYLGKVQNVLPSMEAAFVDIGRGRNAVLYAGEVNYDASALEGRPPRIEQALKSGQTVLVQVTKDPIGHKGARLTSQVSLPGRYMVYVPDGRLSGISRKLPDTERSRLKGILKRLTPEDAGVIIRTAAEGASEEDLERDLNRLHAQWQDIEKKAQTGSAPSLIYGEPDVVIRVIRDIFNEDFKELVVSGDEEWDTVDNYVRWVAPDLAERTRKWTDDEDVFAAYRVDEQLAKALDRKVRLPSRRVRSSSTAPRRWSWSTSTPGSSPARAATSRRPSPRTTSRRPRRSFASCGCATSAGSSSSTSSTWCSRATATSFSGG